MDINSIRLKIKTKMFKSVSCVLSANLISQIESFIFVIIATRGLSIEQYGTYTVVMMLISTVTDLSDMGMNSGITRFSAQYYSNNEIEKEKELVLIAFKRKFFNALVVSIVIILFSKYISIYFFNSTNYSGFFKLSAVGILFTLINGLNIAILQGRQQYNKYFITIVITNLLILAIICILFVIKELNIINILITNVVALIFSCILSYVLVGYKLNIFSKINKLSENVKKSFLSFGRWMVIWSVLAILQSKVDMFMLARLTTVREVSYYDVAMKMSKPVLMILSSYSQVLNPMMATLNSKNEIKKNLNNIIKFITLLSFIILLGVIASKFVITLIFGNQYASSVLPLQIILISLIFFIWSAPYNSALYAMNKPQVFCFAAFLGLITTILGNLFLLNKYGAVGASITFLFAQIVAFIVSYVFYKALIKSN